MKSDLHLCRVFSVIPDQRTISAVSLHDGTRFNNIGIISPSVSAFGSGLDVIPTEGSFCVVCRVKSGEAFVLGFVQLITLDGAGFRAGHRETGLPAGAVSLAAIDNQGKAEVLVLPGGVVSVASSAGNRILMTPDEDLTEILVRNFELRAATGSIKVRLNNDQTGTLEIASTKQLGDNVGVGTLKIADGKVTITNARSTAAISGGEIEIDGESIQLGFGDHQPFLKTSSGSPAYSAAREALNTAIGAISAAVGPTTPPLVVAGITADDIPVTGTAVNTPNNLAFGAIQQALESLRTYLDEIKLTTKTTAE